jgi:hypothetical protein
LRGTAPTPPKFLDQLPHAAVEPDQKIQNKAEHRGNLVEWGDRDLLSAQVCFVPVEVAIRFQGSLANARFPMRFGLWRSLALLKGNGECQSMSPVFRNPNFAILAVATQAKFRIRNDDFSVVLVQMFA